MEFPKLMQCSKLASNLTILLVSISLSGCATFKKQKEKSIDHLSRIQNLSEINKWKLQGRIGVTGKDQRGSANIIWSQDKNKYDMKIIAPVGTKKIMINGDLDHITLKSSSGDNLSSNTPTQTIYDNLGWYLPIDNLAYWVKGIPNNIQKYKWLPSDGNKLVFSQSHWKISFSLSEENKYNSLPRLIVIENNQTKIKISVNKWSINQPDNK